MNPLPALALALDAAGSVLVGWAIVAAALAHARTLGRPSSIPEQQRLLADGMVFALSLKSGAGLVRTIGVHTWDQLGVVLAIIALRFALGRALRPRGWTVPRLVHGASEAHS